MDTLLTSGEAARSLNTSVSRVLRAARAGVVRTTRRGNRTLFDQSGVDQLRALWGQVSAQPGLSREDMQVLAALSRRPRGLRSVRAVARTSGVSPTTAGRALARLAEKGYVAREKVRATEGRVLDVTVWVIRWASPEWLAVAAAVGSVVLPKKAGKVDRSVSAQPLSRDLDFFLQQPVDLEALADALGQRGALDVQGLELAPGNQTLNAYFDATKLQFMEASSPEVLEPFQIVRGLGYLDDVEDDPSVPTPRGEIAAYWERRVPQIVSALSRSH